jgi:hypothetical protein
MLKFTPPAGGTRLLLVDVFYRMSGLVVRDKRANPRSLELRCLKTGLWYGKRGWKYRNVLSFLLLVRLWVHDRTWVSRW